MMKVNTLLPIACAFFLLSACTSSGGDTPDTPEPPTNPTTTKLPIHISTTLSRVTDTGFDNADKAGLYVVNHNSNGISVALQASGNHVDNMRFTYSGSWTPDTPIYWTDETTHADFYLYYPYTPSITDVTAVPFTTQADQSTQAGYKASELLAGYTSDVAPTDKAVGITVQHLMSQLIITVAAGNGFTAEKLAAAHVAVKINGVKTHALVNLQDATARATGEATSITPLKEDGKYKALIVPQTVEKGNLITVTVDGRDYNLPKAFTFVGGKRNHMTVTLNKTSNGINVNIDNWQDDGVDNGGKAE